MESLSIPLVAGLPPEIIGVRTGFGRGSQHGVAESRPKRGEALASKGDKINV